MKTELVQDDLFLKKIYGKALVPCVLSILSGNINLLADGMTVGQYIGPGALAAVSLCVPVYLVLCILGSFFVSGTAVCAAQAAGSGRLDEAQRFCGEAAALCLMASVVITALGLLLLDPVTEILCRDPALAGDVRTYAGITIAGALPKILLYLPFWFLRLDGKNRSITVMMLIMSLGNIILDLVLICCMGQGVAGAALASVISTFAAVVFGLIRLYGGKGNFRAVLAFPRCAKEFRDLAAAGSPAALNNGFQTLRILTVNSLLMEYGGSGAVAVFAAVNGISAFAECVLSGIPQAASALLGNFAGEKDRGSTVLLMRLQWRMGVVISVFFAAAVIAGAPFLGGAYGLDIPFYLPMVCLALSMFPALICTIFSGYYNASGHSIWADGIIFLRVFLLPAVSLYLLLQAGITPWLFLPAGEAAALLVWWIAFGAASGGRFLYFDEDGGSTLSFSVKGRNEIICTASGMVMEFGKSRDEIPARQVMRISLALEELMTFLIEESGEREVLFDIRICFGEKDAALTLRYSGTELNPFSEMASSGADGILAAGDERIMGVAMIREMARQISYQNILGMNILRLEI